MREKPRLREEQKGRDRQREARNRSSHACLPKRTTLSAREGEGRAFMDRGQAEWVLELQLKAYFPLLQLTQGDVLLFKMDLNKDVSQQ